MAKRRKIDIHEYDRQLVRALARMRTAPEISKRNKRMILKFCDRLTADNLSKPRIIYYLGRLTMIVRWLKKDFDQATKSDIERVMRKIAGMDYTEWTRKDYRVTLKKFFKWLKGTEESGIYPEEVRWISTHVSADRQDLPNRLPDEDDAKKMIEAADHPRDKALIAALYESGCRVGEVASLRINDVQFDEYGAHMIVKGKTGSRRVRIVFSAPILASWLNVHPERNDPDAPLWVLIGTTKNRGKNQGRAGGSQSPQSDGLKYRAIASMLVRVAGRAGVKKKVNPHAWRHARATFLANKLTEQQLKHVFGWGQASRMAATYVHLSGRDVDDALLAVYGKRKKVEETGGSALDPLECPRCKEGNEYNNVFCKRCGWALDKQAADQLHDRKLEAEKLLNRLVEDPGTLKSLAGAIERLGLVEEVKKI
ncbi:tyrosine-type recombinase/integrase [Candidatus Sumerlaeota bacterium]